VVASTSDSPTGNPAGFVGASGDPGTVTFEQGYGGTWFASTSYGVSFSPSARPNTSSGGSQFNGYIAGPCIPA
jgi:hypothetical protein